MIVVGSPEEGSPSEACGGLQAFSTLPGPVIWPSRAPYPFLTLICNLALI